MSVDVDELYTSSRLRVARQCPRMHHYRYGLCIQSSPNADTLFGTVGHRALELWYLAWQAGDLDGRLTAALRAVEKLDDEFERIKLRLLVIAYHERWSGEDWEVLGVELEFRYQLGENTIGGKIDALIRDRSDDRTYVVEHKFTGVDTALGGTYWERLAIDTQVSIYIDGANVLGYEVAGCIYDVIKRPGHERQLATPTEKRKYTIGRGCKRCGGSARPGEIQQGRGFYIVAGPGEAPDRILCCECAGTGWKLSKSGEPEAPRLHANQRDTDEMATEFQDRLTAAIADAPDSFLQRSVIVRLEHELAAMRLDIVDTIELARSGLHPRNPDACARFGRMCEFFDACAGRMSIDDEITFPRGPAHPELAAAT